ncbi:unnamed protein product [Acanthoscelides obtectus]|uniref:HTH psq-type domain-containing protein n=1 Tax=Acanthoscelides obtectus TaxID=200917 RepID=A0A9P0M3L8_ACAOB|nr:unnamed protein product [Acanthoscelides obtectus]CAK1634546.1 hypothetical protein AOBTE_LOCUS8799 [Acanthoscelides obtectus]
MVFKMRTDKRKTDRANISAVSEVINGTSMRKAANDNKIDRTTLSRYVNKLKATPDSDVFMEYSNPRQVFSVQQERI